MHELSVDITSALQEQHTGIPGTLFNGASWELRTGLFEGKAYSHCSRLPRYGQPYAYLIKRGDFGRISWTLTVKGNDVEL